MKFIQQRSIQDQKKDLLISLDIGELSFTTTQETISFITCLKQEQLPLQLQICQQIGNLLSIYQLNPIRLFKECLSQLVCQHIFLNQSWNTSHKDFVQERLEAWRHIWLHESFMKTINQIFIANQKLLLI